jgi:hypothetical protein
MAANDLNLLTDQDQIFKALFQSKRECTAIGIRAAVLGPDTMVTCVEDIIVEDGQTIIILKHYDSRGYILPSHKINLFEILAVHPFATPFENPFLANIGKERTWFF